MFISHLRRLVGLDAFGEERSVAGGDYAHLERRIVYSGSPLAGGELPTELSESTDGWVENDVDLAEPDGVAGDLHDVANADLSGLDEVDIELLDAEDFWFGDEREIGQRSELVFVDASTADYEILVQDLLRDRQDASVEVVILDTSQDGLEQISEALSRVSGVDTVHIVSHGENARLQLGAGFLDSASLLSNAGRVAAWGDALADDGDILLYGCELAGDEAGVELVESLATLTGADVGASTDITGHVDHGGDWEFECVAGSLDATAIFSSDAVAAWGHTLQVVNSPETLVNQDASLPAGQTESTAISGGERAARAVGVADNGDHVVVWTGDSGDVSLDDDVYFQRFDRFGTPVGTAQMINQHTAGEQDDVNVVVRGDGSFVAVWESEGQDHGDGAGIYMRMFDSSGIAVTDETLVNETVVNWQGNPDIAMNDNGQFAIVWEGITEGEPDIYLRNYHADGTANTGEINISTGGGANEEEPVVGMDGDGNVVAAWHTTDTLNIEFRRFDFGGTAITSLVEPTAWVSVMGLPVGLDVWAPEISVREDGMTAIVATVTHDSAGSFEAGVVIQVFNADLTGAAAFEDVMYVNEEVLGNQAYASVAFQEDDSLVVVWEGDGPSASGTDVFARTFELDYLGGDPIVVATGDEFVINESTTASQSHVSVSALAEGQFVTAWSGSGAGDDAGVFVRAFGVDPPVADLDSITVSEDGIATIEVLANDAGTGVLTLESYDPSGVVGVLSDNGDGSIGYDPNGQFESLGDSEFAEETFSYTIVDETGESDTATVTIRVTGVNDDPVARSDVYSTVAGVPLTISATASNSLLANDSDVEDMGISFGGIVEDGAGGVVAVDPDGGFTFTPDSGFTGTHQFSYQLLDVDGGTSVGTASIVVSPPGTTADGLLFNTQLPGTATADGIDSWRNSQIVGLTDPNLTLGMSGPTGGTLGPFFDVETDGGSDARLLAFHHVSRDIVMSGGASLQTGDLLMVAVDGSFPVAMTSGRDILRFRPDSPGDYSSGSYEVVLENPALAQLDSITLVEFDSVLGGVVVEAGSLLYSQNGDTGNQQVWKYYDDGVAPSNSVVVDFDGGDFGWSDKIEAMELIERTTSVGGATLNAGSLLLSFADPVTYAATGTTFDPMDVVLVELNEAGSAPMGTASVFADAGDLGLTGNRMQGISLVAEYDVYHQPVVDDQTLARVQEHDALYSATVVASDADDDIVEFEIVDGNSAGIFTIDNAGTLTIANAPLLDYETAASHTLTIRVADSGGRVDLGDVTIHVDDVAEPSISGAVWHDVVGDGADGTDVGFGNVAVLLYKDDGNGLADDADLLVRSTTTSGDGTYVFEGVEEAVYWVAVDSRSIGGSLNSGDFVNGDVWAEQTYDSEGTAYGGRNAGVSDDASRLSTSEHIANVETSGGDVVDIDFGFSFNVVTHTAGGDGRDDDTGERRTVQGALRQFILNANAMAGSNEMRFVPTVAANATESDAAWWKIEITEAMPAITDSLTTIDGRAIDAVDGVSWRDVNAGDAGDSQSVGTGDDGWIGAGSTDEVTLAGMPRPELELYAADGVAIAAGLQVLASDVTVTDVAIHGFGDATGGNVVVGDVGTAVSGFTLGRAILGGDAHYLEADLSSVHGGAGHGIRAEGADFGTIRNSIVVGSDRSGVLLDGASDWVVIGNRIVGNAAAVNDQDGITVTSGGSRNSIRNNYIVDSGGIGVDLNNAGGENAILGNTIVGSGLAGIEQSGVRLSGDGNVVEHNVIHGNAGNGVLVVGDSVGGHPSVENRISENSFSGNGLIAIDLSLHGGTGVGDGVDEIDGPNDTRGNSGLDHPELKVAQVDPSLLYPLRVEFDFVGSPPQQIEFYIATDSDPSDVVGDTQYGEGLTYYGRAEFTGTGYGWAETSGYTLQADDRLTLLSFDEVSNTSEFSNVVELEFVPQANDDDFVLGSGFSISGSVGDNDFDPDGDVFLQYALVSGTEPDSGTLIFNADGTFTYEWDPRSLDTVTFDYSVTDSTGLGGESIAASTATVSLEYEPTSGEVVVVLLPLALGEGSAGTIDDTLLRVVSPAAGPADLVYVIDSSVTHGRLEFGDDPGVALVAGSTFTQEDVDHGNLVYVHDSTDTLFDSFAFSVDEGGGDATSDVFQINILNAEETLVTNSPLSAAEGGTTSISESVLSTADADDGDEELVYTVTSAPSWGRLELLSSSGVAVTEFTQADIRAGQLVYVHDSSDTTNDSFSFVVDDGQGTSTAGEMSLVINNAEQVVERNSPLVLEPGGNVAISALHLLVSDADDSSEEVQYRVVDGPKEGHLEMVDAPGVPVAAFSQDDIDNGRVSYVHLADGGTADAIVFAVDDGQGVASRVVLEVYVGANPQDDAFRLIGGSTLTVGEENGLLVNDLPDTGAARIAALPANGDLVWNGDGSFSYTPDAGFIGDDSFTYTITNGPTTGEATVTLSVVPLGTGVGGGGSVPGDDTPSVPIEADDEDGGTEEDDMVTPGPLPTSRESRPARGSSSVNAVGGDQSADGLPAVASAPQASDGQIRSDGVEARETRYRVGANTTNAEFETGAFGVGESFVQKPFYAVIGTGNFEFIEQSMMSTANVNEWQAHSGLAVTGTLSVGWLVWTIKGSYLVGSLLSTASPWMLVDPLPVLESIEPKKTSKRAAKQHDKLDSMVG